MCVCVTVFCLFFVMRHIVHISYRQCFLFLPFHEMTVGDVEVWGVENESLVVSIVVTKGFPAVHPLRDHTSHPQMVVEQLGFRSRTGHTDRL